MERAKVNSRLRELNRRKDQMIAVVSHDLCSPLTGVRMVVDLLRTDAGESKAELLDLLDHSARRMVSMVHGLLDVGKIEATQEGQLEREELLVSEVIKHSIEPLNINADAKGIAIELEIAPGEELISADPLRVSQIFNNLLNNAVKFTPPRGRIQVKVEPVNGGISTTVTDTGGGIPEAELPHIFDRYYQASTKPTGGEKGAGLGLAIVRDSVTKHGGSIAVKTKLNHGTCFTVFLPGKLSSEHGPFNVAHPTALPALS